MIDELSPAPVPGVTPPTLAKLRRRLFDAERNFHDLREALDAATTEYQRASEKAREETAAQERAAFAKAHKQ